MVVAGGAGVGVGGDVEQLEDLVLQRGEGGFEDLDHAVVADEVVAGGAVEDLEDPGGSIRRWRRLGRRRPR